MKIADIHIGDRYSARVSGVMTTVRVLAIREAPPAWHGGMRRRTRIDVVNERTGRKLSLGSAARLRHANPAEPTP